MLRTRFATLTTTLLLAFSTLSAQAADEDIAEVEIEHLLQFVGSSDCYFIRNDKEHSPEDAESHLRLKYRNGRRYAKTAENFIDRLASESSWSGKVYQVRCGEEEPRQRHQTPSIHTFLLPSARHLHRDGLRGVGVSFFSLSLSFPVQLCCCPRCTPRPCPIRRPGTNHGCVRVAVDAFCRRRTKLPSS